MRGGGVILSCCRSSECERELSTPQEQDSCDCSRPSLNAAFSCSNAITTRFLQTHASLLINVYKLAYDNPTNLDDKSHNF